MTLRSLALAWICTLHLAAIDLVPGRTARIPFPDLPETLAGGTAELHIQVPAGWTPDRPHPILLWYNGGAGQVNISAKWSPGLPYVLVSMPLFKKESTKGTKGTEAIHLDQEDHDLIWKAHSAMFAELDRLVPEQERTHSIVGGFSNGAHCIAVLAGHYPEFVKRFGAFMLMEGGCYMFPNGPKPLAGKKLLCVGGESSLAGQLQAFADAAKAQKIDSTFILLPGEGHTVPKAPKQVAETQAWVRDQVLYAGLPEAIAAMQAAITARKWPQALAAWRQASAVVDEKRAEWSTVQQGLGAIDAGCAEAASKLKANATGKELRTFVATWQPCPATAEVRTRADAIGQAELAKVAGDASARRRELLRLHGDWARYPVQAAILAALDALAADDLTAAEREPQPATRLKALLRIRSTYPACAAVDRAMTAADAIGQTELAKAEAEKSEAARAKRLQAICKTYAGLPCADTAAAHLDAIAEAQATALLDRILALPKGPERTRQLKAFIERYAGTDAADRAEKAK
jgi:dienelactone hydrolase